MYKVDVPLDAKEAASIERRKNLENARKSRIFDSKSRTIGVDVSALDAQVQEAREKKLEAKKIHEAYASMQIKNDMVGQLLQNHNARTEKVIEKDLVSYRTQNQPKNSTREWDLNDPNALKKQESMPKNVGMSGLQRFAGEDENYTNRSILQKEQNCEWSLARQAERKAALQQQKQRDNTFHENRLALDMKALELEEKEKKAKQAALDACTKFNLELAEEKRILRKNARKQEIIDNEVEINNQVNGALLTEDSRFEHKGLSEEKLAELRNVQTLQVEQNRQKNAMEKEERETWYNQQTATATAGILLDREQARKRVALRKAMDMENARLAAEQKLSQKQKYSNVPSDEYYDQFNKTTR